MLKDYDQKLSIHTSNRSKPAKQPPLYYQYEATPYPILHELFSTYKLKTTDHFVDFGCGKGRVLYYVHNYFHTSVTGIEINEQLYQKAKKNKMNYLKNVNSNHGAINIRYCRAEDYKVKKRDNIFYFFNPFTIQIFKKVIRNILFSIAKNPRNVDIILYYPETTYTNYLKTETSFQLIQKIKVPHLYEINPKEHFLIFRYNC